MIGGGVQAAAVAAVTRVAEPPGEDVRVRAGDGVMPMSDAVPCGGEAESGVRSSISLRHVSY